MANASSISLKTSDLKAQVLLQSLLKQLKILNIHMEMMTDSAVKESDTGKD